jgi:uncharacterized membrane protein
MVLMVPYYIVMMAVMLTNMPKGRSEPENPAALVIGMFGLEMVFFLVVMVVSILIETFFMFAFPLVADRNMSGLDAVKLSFRAGKANFRGIVGLLLLNALFGFVGLLCCIIGVYFYLPVSFASMAIAYRRVFPDIPAVLPTPPPPPASWA